MNDFFSFTTFFQTCCFSLLLFFIKWVFERYVLQGVKEAIARKREALVSLRHRYIRAQQEKERVMAQTAAKSEFAHVLLKNLEVWGLARQHHCQAVEQERELSQKRVRIYLDEQREWLLAARTQSEVLPRAIDAAQNELQERFADRQERQVFLEKVIAGLVREEL